MQQIRREMAECFPNPNIYPSFKHSPSSKDVWHSFIIKSNNSQLWCPIENEIGHHLFQAKTIMEKKKSHEIAKNKTPDLENKWQHLKNTESLLQHSPLDACPFDLCIQVSIENKKKRGEKQGYFGWCDLKLIFIYSISRLDEDLLLGDGRRGHIRALFNC